MIVLVLGAWIVGPAGMVGAPIQKPSLDWFDEGHQFYYRFTNGTTSYAFNATIVNVTADTVVWKFWNHFNGSDQAFEKVHINKTREHLNFTDAWTYMWINQTDVDTGTATIGTETYSLNALESDTEVLVFEGNGKRLEYDAEDGWLLEMRSDESSTIWELNGTGDRNGQIDGEDVDTDVECEDPYFRLAHEKDTRGTGIESEAAVCSLPRDPGDEKCFWELKARSTVTFPEVFLYDHNATHEFYDEDGLLIDSAHYEMADDPPPMDELNETTLEHRNTTVVEYTAWHVDTQDFKNEADIEVTTQRWDQPSYKADVTLNAVCNY